MHAQYRLLTSHVPRSDGDVSNHATHYSQHGKFLRTASTHYPYFRRQFVPENEYESRTKDLYVIKLVLFPVLKNIYKSIFMGNKQGSCTDNYGTCIQPNVTAYFPRNTRASIRHIRRLYKAIVNETHTHICNLNT
jgi:hypothetical protein